MTTTSPGQARVPYQVIVTQTDVVTVPAGPAHQPGHSVRVTYGGPALEYKCISMRMPGTTACMVAQYTNTQTTTTTRLQQALRSATNTWHQQRQVEVPTPLAPDARPSAAPPAASRLAISQRCKQRPDQPGHCTSPCCALALSTLYSQSVPQCQRSTPCLHASSRTIIKLSRRRLQSSTARLGPTVCWTTAGITRTCI